MTFQFVSESFSRGNAEIYREIWKLLEGNSVISHVLEVCLMKLS